MVLTGRNRISIRNILVGEVWLQSNMEWSLPFLMKAIANADHPSIRLFHVGQRGFKTSGQLPGEMG